MCARHVAFLFATGEPSRLGAAVSHHTGGIFIKRLSLLFWFVFALCGLGAASRAFGHGFAGARFFPATLSTDDPFVADELSLPTINTIRTTDDGGTRETDISVDIAKRITPQFGIEIGETMTVLNPHEGRAANGFGNLELGGKYQFLKSDAHEAIVSVGLGVEIGGTGSNSIDADSFSTWSPAIFFGKGFGDLPEALRFLKPIAITGVAGIAIPTSASTRSITVNDQTDERDIKIEQHPDVLQWGFALEYSVIYLQSQVQDMHLPSPIDRLIPLVEFAMETPLNRGPTGPTTGTINPGVIWAGNYFQVGVEAVIPINEHTGNNVGVIAQLHFFLDDLFPHTIGRPLFGGNE